MRVLTLLACALVVTAGTVTLSSNATAEGIPGVTPRLEDPLFEEIQTAVPAASFEPLARCGAPQCGPPSPCDPCCKRLRFSVTLVGWLTAMDGTVGSGDREVDVDLSVGDVIDILDKVDGLFQGNVRADYGKWWGRFSFSYIKLAGERGFTLNPGPGPGVSVPVGAEITQSYYQLVGGYNLKTSAGPKVGCCCSSIRYDVFAGARWADMKLLVTTPGRAFSASQDWVDPIVGGAVTWDLKNRWMFDVDADIGGFGVNSSLTWRLRLGAQWSPTRWLGIVGGWMFLDYDYTTGSGASRFKWDVLTHGPYIGLNFRF